MELIKFNTVNDNITFSMFLDVLERVIKIRKVKTRVICLRIIDKNAILKKMMLRIKQTSKRYTG